MEQVKEYGANWWLAKLDEAEKRLKNDHWKSADEIVKKYKGKKGNESSGERIYLYNVFWANVGVMKAALYAKRPKPMVERTWSDMNDNIGRVSSEILKRCLMFDFTKNISPMDRSISMAVEDRLIPGIGCIWMRYEMETEMVTIPGTENIPGQAPIQFESISKEDAPCDYVQWRDVVYPAARIWEEVWFIARKIYMTPPEFKAKFNKKVDRNSNAETRDDSNIFPKGFSKGKVTVYEIWCKRSNMVYWVCRELPGWCKEKKDFLELDDFYPCPRFLMATHTSDDFLPRPDFTMIKDQYDQLNELNTRCVILEQALRVVGFYDSKNAEMKTALTVARENDMIPVQKWAVLQEGGGMDKAVEWFPIEMVANVLEKLTVQKAEKVTEIFQLTGISDIMRGDTQARETLGAQELKSQYSSVRLQFIQGDVSQFVREALIIKAQIICRHFQDETILKISNMQSTPDAQYLPQALALLRDSQMTEYKIDINEEGLALPDYNQEKQTRIEFLTTVGQFLSQAAPITAAMPGALPYLIQMVRWVAAGLRGSNEIQGVLDQAINALNQNPPQQQSGPPPDTTKIQAEQIKQQGETQRIPMKAKVDGQLNQQKADLELRNMTAQQHLQATHQQAHDATIQQLQTSDKAAQTVTDAMVQASRDAHEFARAARLQARDHDHEQQLQDSAPTPGA